MYILKKREKQKADLPDYLKEIVSQFKIGRLSA
jgi:hypothetical protein